MGRFVLTAELTAATRELIAAIEDDTVPAARGYLVGLDRPALLAPDPAALLAANRPADILARGHRWRVVNRSLWDALQELERVRPEQQVYVIQVADLQVWNDPGLSEIDRDGWRGDQGTSFVLPITRESE